jgi:endonuclease G|tara:strand:+ start:113 stop:838 length:726 start_codon:yes stop_codon:yes gene_type:complete
MKKIIFFFVLSPLIAFSQVFSDFLPISNGELVNHTYYSLSYSERHEQAEWVFYEIRKERILGLVSRTSDFRNDEKINTKSADLIDYRRSGYDRGHLAPASDFSFNTIAMSESFYMSNMSPQHPSFNRGIWRKLESLVRKWGNNSSIYIVTGPILDDCSTTIGLNNVCVPKYYYKVIYQPAERKMIAFVLLNDKGDYKLSHYITSVDYVESITGIDFFPILEDKIEERLESEVSKENWLWDE